MPTTQPDRRPPSDGDSSDGSGTGIRAGGARTGEDWTSTPGPAAVATSDQDFPFHHRTRPDVPSGSGYQPGGGAGWPGPVTATTLGRRPARGRPRPLLGRPPLPQLGRPGTTPSSPGCAPPGAASPRTSPACSSPKPDRRPGW